MNSTRFTTVKQNHNLNDDPDKKTLSGVKWNEGP